MTSMPFSSDGRGIVICQHWFYRFPDYTRADVGDVKGVIDADGVVVTDVRYRSDGVIDSIWGQHHRLSVVQCYSASLPGGIGDVWVLSAEMYDPPRIYALEGVLEIPSERRIGHST